MFKKIDIKELDFNFVDGFKNKWALLTVENENDINTMTIAWGMIGVLWRKDVAIVYVRPSRYTYNLIEKAKYYTIAFFDEKYKDVLAFCGRNSKRDVDKIDYCKLNIKKFAHSISFEEANLVIEIKKLYSEEFKENLISDKDVKDCYPNKDYSVQYIGEIIGCYKKKD